MSKKEEDELFTEIWKPIAGYEGVYEVSNTGKVRSVDRVYYQKSRHGTMMHKHYVGQEIVPEDNGHGYMTVRLMHGGKKVMRYVHRLVAEAHVQNPNGYQVVNHLDFDKKNNSSSNLEWTTTLDNVRHSQKNMCKPRKNCKPTSTGEKHIIMRGDMYRLSIRDSRIRFDRRYKTLEEAVRMREVILNGEKHLAG